MEKTNAYQLNQWDPDDRILREDFNADNAKLDTALSTLAASKLELVELLNVTETLDGVSSWRVELPFNAGDYLALFFEYTLPGTAVPDFSPYAHTLSPIYTLRPPYAAIACFPLRNPEQRLCYIPIGGANGTIKYLDYAARQLTNIALSNSTMQGEHGLRVLAIR